MNKLDINHILEFLDEVEALYEADSDGDYIPEYIEDYVKSIRLILLEEEAEDTK
jgi:hypothetical protein